MARVLWTASFQAGSYFPAAPVALELAARGHEVVVMSEARSEEAFRLLGFDFLAHRSLDAYAAAAVRPRDRASKLRYFEGCVPALFDDVRTELASGAYDALMFDPLDPGVDFAAETAGVPSFSYVHWKMNETGPDVPFCFHLWDGVTPPEVAFVEWWNGLRALVGLGPEPRPESEHRWYRHSRRLTLMLGLPELVHPMGALPSYAVRVGPTLWDPPDVSVPEWVESLGHDRPAVLVSVSTVDAADTEMIGALAEALSGEDVDAVLTLPVAADLPRLADNVRLAPFVSHTALIARSSLVICQAGNGTVTRAACAGVPLLLIPNGRDRFEVARGAVAAGIAVSIDREQLTAAAARDAVRVLLSDPEYRRRALEVAAAATMYTAPATSAAHVETLLRETVPA